jgi:CheY-like chemotaxis protein
MAAPQGETLKGHADPFEIRGEGLAGLVRRAVVQAASKELVESIVTDALSRADSEVIPVSAGPLTVFVLGPLFDAVLHADGVDAAMRTVKILKPVLRKRSELELGELPPTRKKTVMIVDQDIVVRAQLLSILSGAGYEAISASDGNVALAMSVRCRPDLIISAIDIGSARGNQLATLLRVAFNEDAPPIIILTEGERWLDSAAGVCVVPKPVDRIMLLSVMGPLLGSKT